VRGLRREKAAVFFVWGGDAPALPTAGLAAGGEGRTCCENSRRRARFAAEGFHPRMAARNGKSAVQMALHGALPLGKMKMGERKKRIGKFAAAGRLPAADGR